MTGAGISLAKKIGIAVIGDLIFYLGCKAVKNKLNGKTIFGRKIEPKQSTYVDWRGNVILGTDDGTVV